MDLLELINPLREEMTAVEDEILRLTESSTHVIQRVARHTMGAGGKRLRPFLTLLSAKATGGINPNVITLASLIELAHTAALIHDDVVDEADTRRGKPSANMLWGNEATVLVGDFFISLVILILSRDEFRGVQHFVAAAANRMCVGQVLEVEMRRKLDISEVEYTRLIRDKTAELISAACYVGAVGSGASETTAQTLGDYGLNLGLTFQIVDDMLDITSNGSHLGKPIGNDLREGKITLPYIHALANAESGDRDQLLAHLSDPRPSDEVIRDAARLVRAYDGIDYSRRVARGYAQAAQDALESLEDSPTKDALRSVAEFVLLRDK